MDGMDLIEIVSHFWVLFSIHSFYLSRYGFNSEGHDKVYDRLQGQLDSTTSKSRLHLVSAFNLLMLNRSCVSFRVVTLLLHNINPYPAGG